MSKTSFDREKLQKENEEKLETEAVNMIIERIIDNKPSLYWHYTREVLNSAIKAMKAVQVIEAFKAVKVVKAVKIVEAVKAVNSVQALKGSG